MKTRPTRRADFWPVALLLLALIPIQGFAQNDTPDDEDIFELSPFVVDADSQTGYLATETLAGTRIKMQLRDVASTVSVLTKDLMEDTAVSDPVDLLVLAPNTEVAGLAGNYSATDVQRGGWVSYGPSRSIGSQTRVRGLASADNTRDFFATSIPFDPYNVESVEVSRGSNSFLFGLGSPAGIINYTTIRAQMDNFGEAQFRFDQWGTGRASLDLNRELIEDKWAIRVALLEDNRRFQQEEAFDDQTRAFLATTIQPMEGLTIRASYEATDILSSQPSIDPPRDRLTWWWHPDVNKLVWNPAVWDYRDTGSLTNSLVVSMVDGGYNAALFYSDQESLEPDPSVVQWSLRDSVGGFTVRNPNAESPNRRNRFRYRTASMRNSREMRRRFSAQNQPQPTWWSPGDPVPSGWSRDNATAELAQRSLIFNEQILDPTIFDFYNHQLSGGNDRQGATPEVANITIEQLLLDNKLGFELAYNSQNYDSFDFDYLQGQRGRSIGIDINTTDNLGNPNPNFGRPVIGSRTNYSEFSSNREIWRATAFYELDWTDYTDSWVSKVLGRHVLTGSYTNDSASTFYRAGRAAHYADWFMAQLERDGQYSNGDVQFSHAHYIGPSLANASSPAGANFSSLPEGRWDIPRFLPNNTYIEYATGQWITNDIPILSVWRDPTVIRRTQGSNASASETDIESTSFTLQNYFFSGNLVATVGWRTDTIQSSDVQAGARDAIGNLTYEDLVFGDDPELDATEETVSYSVVAHMPQSWRENLPLGLDLSAHYAESENFRPTGLRRDIFGNTFAPAGGETTEYGFTVRLLQDRFIARFNWYETSQVNDTDQPMSDLIPGILKTERDVMRNNPQWWLDEVGFNRLPAAVEAAMNFNPTELADGTGWDVDSTGSTAGMVEVSDTVSEGFEFEGVFNPTRNWRIALNISQQEAIRSNRGNTIEPVIEFIQQNWARGTQAGDNLYEAGPDIVEGITLAGRASQQVLNAWTLEKSLDGIPVNEMREWRWSLVTNYTFTEGRLAGFSFGGAMRWEDEVGIGYPLIYDGDINDFLPDINNPFFGESQDHYDAWIGYQRDIADGKVNWKIQLNIRNVDDDQSLIKVAAQPVAGLRDIVRLQEGRRFILTNTFSF